MLLSATEFTRGTIHRPYRHGRNTTRARARGLCGGLGEADRPQISPTGLLNADAAADSLIGRQLLTLGVDCLANTNGAVNRPSADAPPTLILQARPQSVSVSVRSARGSTRIRTQRVTSPILSSFSGSPLSLLSMSRTTSSGPGTLVSRR